MALRFEDPGFLPAPDRVTHDPLAPRNGDGHDYRYLKDACNHAGIEDTSEARMAGPRIDRHATITDKRTLMAEVLSAEDSQNMHNMTPEDILMMFK